MKIRAPWNWIAVGVSAIGAGLFCYGMTAERHRLMLNSYPLKLRNWPESLQGFRIALVADFHVRNLDSAFLAARAIDLALRVKPDAIVIAGDIVDEWSPELPKLVGDLMLPLKHASCPVILVPGNHDYHEGNSDPIAMICQELGIHCLRNQAVRIHNVVWVGIDSYQAGRHEVSCQPPLGDHPQIVVWHEPDANELLTREASLMLSGHSHGGQFVLPGGWAPKHSDMGRKYVRGFFPDTVTPLFVTTGVGTTFLPSRLNCPPEVALLSVSSA
jgi:predicted MPP superfamily phosphohydrolase